MADKAQHMTQSLEKARNVWPTWLLAAWLAAALLAPGCGQGTCQADRQLGSCCDTDADCEGELICLDRFPGGLCSFDCGEDPFCPIGSRCIHIISQSKGDLGRACLKLCGPDYESCRSDYACTNTSEPDVKVCFPG